ncbi:LacI family DNA-binding transcriptional regulator [Paenibacillus gansuensis]|uniref:LacI family DNA-binding transcriptional regulator n=1 Tax=Paenibacillus gansuensis TaxID=306542 RepID=A0ABW5PGA8_9BACL
MTTIYDIAKLANVSAMTVSKVINNTGSISEKTKAKVRRVMEELNYVPNQMARGLVTQQTRLLFLLITDITNPFYTTLARGAEDAARKYGYRLLFGNSDESLEKESGYLDTILGARADGVLFSPAGDRSLPHLQKLRKQKIPFVLLDREVPGMDCDVVLGDSKEGAKLLINHLAERGHRRIALINGSSEISSARLRAQGYAEAHKLNDLELNEDYVLETDYTSHQDLRVMSGWLDRLSPRPTAILACNNILASEAIETIRAKGLKVPDDISVVCFDDLGYMSRISPFLTVIAQQAYEIGYLGTQLLIERIQDKDGQRPWKKLILPVELISRSSVADISGQG